MRGFSYVADGIDPMTGRPFGGDNSGDGDRTRGNDGTRGGDNSGDGDRTRGGDNSGNGGNGFKLRPRQRRRHGPSSPEPSCGRPAVTSSRNAVRRLASECSAKRRWMRWGGGVMTPKAELEKIEPDGWMLTKLEGLKAALEIAGDVPNFKDDPDANEISWIEDERGWMFGKVTGTIGKGTFGAPGQGADGGETIGLRDGSPWAIGLTGTCDLSVFESTCDLSVFEMEPEDEPGDDPAVRRARSVRRATGVFVHEFAHTAYARFNTEWDAFCDGPGKGETPPTEYANKSAEENFCETFMLYKLYRDQLQTRAPLRERWMASNPLLGDVVPPVPAALAANA